MSRKYFAVESKCCSGCAGWNAQPTALQEHPPSEAHSPQGGEEEEAGSGNVANIPTWRKSAGMLAEKLTRARLKWDVGASLGPQPLAGSPAWDSQEQHVGKPSKKWRRRRRRTASGCCLEESAGFGKPSNKKVKHTAGQNIKVSSQCWYLLNKVFICTVNLLIWKQTGFTLTCRWIKQSLLLNNNLILHTCNI